jgi:hypothetical protein
MEFKVLKRLPRGKFNERTKYQTNEHQTLNLNELNDKCSTKNKDWNEFNVKMKIIKKLTFALCNYYFVKPKSFFQ